MYSMYVCMYVWMDGWMDASINTCMHVFMDAFVVGSFVAYLCMHAYINTLQMTPDDPISQLI